MPPNYYEGLALLFSYVFMALAALIVVFGFLWVQRDSRARKRTLLTLPDAGSVGELAVSRGENEKLPRGTCIPIPHEGILGSARACDIRVPHVDVPARAAHLILSRNGLVLTPLSGRRRKGEALKINGKPCEGAVTLAHGSRLQWGALTLRLRLFEGTQALAESRGAVVEDGAPLTVTAERLRQVTAITRRKKRAADTAEIEEEQIGDTVETAPLEEPAPPAKSRAPLALFDLSKSPVPSKESADGDDAPASKSDGVEIPLGVDTHKRH